MNQASRPQPHDPAAEEHAALWAARLDESPSLAPDARAELDAWLAADPAHRDLLAGYCQLSADLEEQLPALVAAGCVAPPAAAPCREVAIRRRRNLWWSMSAVCATLAAVACAFLFLPTGRRVADFSTVAAQRRALDLPDGSRVELNASTSLSFEQNRDERLLHLERGQAYFVVAKDRSRPFIVDTPAGSIRVTGTIFDARMTPAGELEVTVVEGSVQVKPSLRAASDARASAPTDNPVVSLGANDRLTCGRSGLRVQALAPSACDDLLAWRQGRIVFDSVPLGEALARFSSYHNRPIVAAPNAATLRLSGRFSLDDFDGFVGSVQQILPVSSTRDAAGTLHVTLNPVR